MASKLHQSLLPLTLRRGTRPFTASAGILNGKPTGSDNAANANQELNSADRKEANSKSQSNASQEEHKSGDDHPAKQPDPQEQPSRSTGIGGGNEVEGERKGWVLGTINKMDGVEKDGKRDGAKGDI